MMTQLFVYTHTHDSSTISMFYVNVLGNGDKNFGRNQTQSGASSPLANEGTVCDSGSIKTNWIETLRVFVHFHLFGSSFTLFITQGIKMGSVHRDFSFRCHV